MATGIGSPLALGGLYPSVDGRYVAANGKPFTSVSNAESALNGFPSKLSESCIGLTVLVKESGWTEAKEYWVQPKGTTPETYGLVDKHPQIDTSGFATKTEVSAKQDALPSGTAGQILKKTTNSVEWDDMPSIEDGENTAVALEGTIHVSAVDAQEGESAGVEIMPHSGGGVNMKFTLPKGADGQDGARGNDAVNPFKGYYPTGVSLPTTGAVGDYLYAPPSDSQSTATATIWHYDSTQTPPWTDTEIDVSAVVGVEFGSRQAVTATKIKDEIGEEVTGPADVLSAAAGATLKGEIDTLNDKFDGLTEYKVVYTFNGTTSNVVLNSPIILSEEGDYLQFDAAILDNIPMVYDGYNLAVNGTAYSIGLGVASGVNKLNVKINNNNVSVNLGINISLRHTYKIINEIVDGSCKTNLYVDNEFKQTLKSDTQFYQIKVTGFGSGYSTGHWKGTLLSIIYNGNEILLENQDVFSNVQITKFPKVAEYDLYVQKTNKEIWMYKRVKGNKFIRYSISKETGSTYSVWMLNFAGHLVTMMEYDYGQFIKCDNIFSSGAVELAINVPKFDIPNENEYVGTAVHGYEIYDNIIINIDGVVIPEADTYALQPANSIHVIQSSKLWQYGDTEHVGTATGAFAQVLKHWVCSIDDANSLKISTSIEFLTNISVANNQMAMFDILRHSEANDDTSPYLVASAIANDKANIYDVRDGWVQGVGIGAKSFSTNVISLFGEKGYNFAVEIRDDNRESNGGMYISTNGSVYNKVYFDAGSHDARVGDKKYATQIWYFY